MLIEAEASARCDRKVAKLVREMRFKLPTACVEEAVYLPERKLSRDRVARPASCDWAKARVVVVIISKNEYGKSCLGQALGNATCRQLFTVRYTRLADIMDDLNRCQAAADGSYYEHMDAYKWVQLLIVDDFLATPIETRNVVGLFEIMEARESQTATPHRLPARTQRVVPENRERADGRLNTERDAKGTRYIDLDGPNMREHPVKKKDR